MEIIKNGFKNERLGIELDVYIIDEKEWFKAQDVSEFLGYKDTRQMTRSIEITDSNSCLQTLQTGAGNNYEALFMNESGLYEIIFSITKRDMERYAKAREFQFWVFSEVLPSIRKNGYYVDEKNITQEQYDRLKDTLLLFCQNGKIGLPSASEKIFGNKKELNDRLVAMGKIDRINCTYAEDWVCVDGDKKYPIFVCDKKGKYADGVVTKKLQVSLTNYGFVFLKELFHKNPDMGLNQSKIF